MYMNSNYFEKNYLFIFFKSFQAHLIQAKNMNVGGYYYPRAYWYKETSREKFHLVRGFLHLFIPSAMPFPRLYYRQRENSASIFRGLCSRNVYFLLLQRNMRNMIPLVFLVLWSRGGSIKNNILAMLYFVFMVCCFAYANFLFLASQYFFLIIVMTMYQRICCV